MGWVGQHYSDFDRDDRVLADTSSSRPCPWGLGGLGGLDPEKNGWANLANALVALLAYL